MPGMMTRPKVPETAGYDAFSRIFRDLDRYDEIAAEYKRWREESDRILEENRKYVEARVKVEDVEALVARTNAEVNAARDKAKANVQRARDEAADIVAAAERKRDEHRAAMRRLDQEQETETKAIVADREKLDKERADAMRAEREARQAEASAASDAAAAKALAAKAQKQLDEMKAFWEARR